MKGLEETSGLGVPEPQAAGRAARPGEQSSRSPGVEVGPSPAQPGPVGNLRSLDVQAEALSPQESPRGLRVTSWLFAFLAITLVKAKPVLACVSPSDLG